MTLPVLYPGYLIESFEGYEAHGLTESFISFKDFSTVPATPVSIITQESSDLGIESLLLTQTTPDVNDTQLILDGALSGSYATVCNNISFNHRTMRGFPAQETLVMYISTSLGQEKYITSSVISDYADFAHDLIFSPDEVAEKIRVYNFQSPCFVDTFFAYSTQTNSISLRCKKQNIDVTSNYLYTEIAGRDTLMSPKKKNYTPYRIKLDVWWPLASYVSESLLIEEYMGNNFLNEGWLIYYFGEGIRLPCFLSELKYDYNAKTSGIYNGTLVLEEYTGGGCLNKMKNLYEEKGIPTSSGIEVFIYGGMEGFV